MDIRKNNEIIGLYENYGLRVIGKTGVYHSHVFNEEHDIITHIGIINTVTGEKIYSETLENNFINMNIFSNCINEILFYFSHNKLDSYSINKTIYDVLVKNNGSLFVHRMKQEIAKEEEQIELMKKIDEHENNHNQVISACNEKNYTLCNIGSTFYVLSFQNENNAKQFMSLQDNQKQFYIDNIYQIDYMDIIASQEINSCYGCNKWYYPEIEKLLDKIA